MQTCRGLAGWLAGWHSSIFFLFSTSSF
jgi:hypothetical protein